MRTLVFAVVVGVSGCASPLVRSYDASAAQDLKLSGVELVGEYGLPASSVEVVISTDQPAAKPEDGSKAAICAEFRKAYNQDRLAALQTKALHEDFLEKVKEVDADYSKAKAKNLVVELGEFQKKRNEFQAQLDRAERTAGVFE